MRDAVLALLLLASFLAFLSTAFCGVRQLADAVERRRTAGKRPTWDTDLDAAAAAWHFEMWERELGSRDPNDDAVPRD